MVILEQYHQMIVDKFKKSISAVSFGR